MSQLIPRNSRVLVGYSGGADSTCLLHLMRASGIDIVAGHLDHGQRPEAKKELKLCEAFANELDVPFVSGRANVPDISREMKLGIEEAGRHARYSFFRQAARQFECDLIATGHTRSDLVETVFLNMTRGSGLSGLAGIPERREEIVRPLLGFSRSETRAYCVENGLWFHDDPGNENPDFSRTRIRARILPELRELNPQVEEAVARLAEIVREEDHFLNGMAAAALERSEIPLNGPLRFLTEDVEVCFSLESLSTLPSALFRRSIRLACEALGGALDYNQTRVVESSIASGGSGSVTCAGAEVVLEWDKKRALIRQLLPTTPFRHVLTLPGETISDEFGWQFVAFREEAGRGGGTALARTSLGVRVSNTVGALYFRTALPGDKLQPLGFGGHRKVSDLLAEAELTLAARARLPIVCDLLGPFWIPGVCLDERVRPVSEGSATTNLQFRKLGGEPPEQRARLYP